MPQAPRTALVTGAASGMGRIIAKRLRAQGARVALLDLNEKGLQDTAGGDADMVCIPCDIGDKAAVEAAVGQAISALGPLDRVVHAAALMPSRWLMNTDADEVMRLTQVNYAGTLYVVHAVLPAMLQRDRGEIVVFGSIAGTALVPGLGAYCATKAAVNAYMESLINELSHTGLGLHLVCPPAVNTPLVDQTMVVDTPGSIAEAKKSGRLADPEKIVDAIDKGIAKGKAIIYPGEARFLKLWHDLLPSLWWKVVMGFDKREEMGASGTAAGAQDSR